MKARRVVWALGIAALLFVAAEASIFWFQRVLSVREQRIAGRLLASQALLITHWKNLEDKDPFIEFVQKLSEKFTHQAHTVRFISPDPDVKSEQPKDDFERDLLARFANDAQDERSDDDLMPFGERRSGDRTEYRYYQPVFLKEQCFLTCHQPAASLTTKERSPSPTGRAAPGERKWKNRELMVIVEITIPMPLRPR